MLDLGSSSLTSGVWKNMTWSERSNFHGKVVSLKIVKGSCRGRRGIRHQKAFNKSRNTAILGTPHSGWESTPHATMCGLWQLWFSAHSQIDGGWVLWKGTRVWIPQGRSLARLRQHVGNWRRRGLKSLLWGGGFHKCGRDICWMLRKMFWENDRRCTTNFFAEVTLPNVSDTQILSDWYLCHW